MKGYICEHCGAALDPGERCDCRDVRVVVLRSDGSLEVSVTDGKIETYQSIVGGYVERIPSLPTISLLVNEDGKRLGLPRNPFFPGYVGNIILIKDPRAEETEFRSFNEYETTQLLQIFAPTRRAI